MHRPTDNRHFRQLLLEAVEKATVEMDRREKRRKAAKIIQSMYRGAIERGRRHHAATTLQRAWRAKVKSQPACGGWIWW